MKRLFLVATFLSQASCFKAALAPHLSRESELGPLAASERFGTVLDKATAFERQNEKSRDVHWYRLWRASAMIEMGQAQESLQLIDQVMRDVAVGGKTPAQPDRFRMFAYDLQARALLVLNRPNEALPLLERSYGLAGGVGLEAGGDCNVEIMMAARAQQIEEVASLAGDASRAASAREERARHVDRWTKCLTSRDFPGLRTVSSIADALKRNGAPEVKSAPPPVAIAPPPPPPPAATPPPRSEPVAPPPPPAAPIGSIASLPLAGDRFAPIDASPYRAGIDAAMPLLKKHAGPRVSASMAIRADGRYRALKVEVDKALANTSDLVPLFEATVVFFEQTRGVEAGVDRVIIATKDAEVIGTKPDIFDLFVGKIDARTFASRLQRIR